MTRMKTIFGAAACAALLAGTAAQAQSRMGAGHDAAQENGLHVAHGWARATPGMARAGAAYVTIDNAGTTDDRLVGAETPVSARAEIHTHVMDGAVMRMRAVEGGVALPAGKAVTFRPGGLHVMLMGLKAPLKEGDRFPLTLTFEKAGKKTVEVSVRKVGASAPADGHGMGHGR